MLKHRSIAHTGTKAQLIARLQEADSTSASKRLGKVSRDAIEKSSAKTSSKLGLSSQPDDLDATPASSASSVSTSSGADTEVELARDASSSTEEEDENPRTGRHLERFRVGSNEPAQDDDNFVVEAFLMDVYDPEVSRKVSCPASATMYELHLALNVALGWSNSHGSQFEFLSGDAIFRPMVEGADAKHLLLCHSRAASGGEGTEDAEGFTTFHDMENTRQGAAEKLKIGDMLTRRHWLGEADKPTFIYEYDFGSGWQHGVQVLGRAPKTTQFECIGGTGHPCAEDTIPPQWEVIKEAYQKPKARRDQEEHEQLDWCENSCLNGDKKGLGSNRKHKWDMKEVNRSLEQLNTMI